MKPRKAELVTGGLLEGGCWGIPHRGQARAERDLHLPFSHYDVIRFGVLSSAAKTGMSLLPSIAMSPGFHVSAAAPDNGGEQLRAGPPVGHMKGAAASSAWGSEQRVPGLVRT